MSPASALGGALPYVFYMRNIFFKVENRGAGGSSKTASATPNTLLLPVFQNICSICMPRRHKKQENFCGTVFLIFLDCLIYLLSTHSMISSYKADICYKN